MNKLIRIKKIIKIVLVSATPLDEIKVLNCECYLKFTKKRETINLIWCATDKPYFTIERYMNAALANKKYDRVVVFSDGCVRALYDNKQLELVGKCADAVAMLHSEYKSTGDIDRITKNEKLDRKLTLCTSLGFNGLNFKNENEHILVIVDIRLGNDTAWKIIQCIGRIRKSNVGCLVVARMEESLLSVEEKRLYVDTLKNAGAEHDIFYFSESLTDNFYYNAMVDIEKYVEENSKTDVILKTLEDTGYINIKQTKETNDFSRYRNSLRDKMSNKIKEQILLSNDKLSCHLDAIDELDDEINSKVYYDEMLSKTNRIMKDKNINIQMLQQLFERENVDGRLVGAYDNQLQISTIMDNLRFLFNVVEHPGDVNKIEENLKRSWDEHKNQVVIKLQKSQLDRIHRYEKKYCDKVITDCEIYNAVHGNNGYCKMGVLLEYKHNLVMKQYKSIMGRIDAHARPIVIDGTTYTSVEDAAKHTGKTRRTIHNWLKSGKANYVD